MSTLRISIFEHLLFSLREWYMELNSINDQEFILQNDFSILKLIKLDFLVTAINSHNDPSILEVSSYYALPYGPVETSIYNALRDNSIPGYTFSRVSLKQIKDQASYIEEKYIASINQSIEILRDKQPNLINMDAGSLVDITHRWHAWKKSYSLARKLNSYSSKISNKDISNDMKILTLY